MLSKILRDLGEHFSVCATYGRLFDIEPVEPYEFIRTGRVKWIPVNEGRVKAVLDRLEGSSEVIVATDSDIEGEVIAWHIQRLAEIAGTKISRVHVKSVNENGIREALANPTNVDIKKAEGGVARRIFDNFSQFSIDQYKVHQKPYLKGSIGRVVSPLLSSCAESRLTTSIIKKKLPACDVDAFIKVPSGIDPSFIESKVENLPRPFLINPRKNSEQINPLDLTDCVSLVSSALKLSPGDAFENIKDLFDKGRISYFRTDSRRISGQSMEKMAQSLRQFTNIKECTQNKFIENTNSQNAHEALMPLEIHSNPFSTLSNMRTDDAIMSLLWRYYALVVNGSMVHTSTFDLSCSAVESMGWSSLSKLGCEIEFTRSMIETPSGALREWDPSCLPMGVSVSSNTQGNTVRRDYSIEEMIFNRLTELDLGRPSTISFHAAKLSSRFITDGKVNGRGKSAIEEARSVAPGLVNIDIARRITSELHAPSDSVTVTDKVIEALDQSGWIKKASNEIALEKGNRRLFSQSFEM